MKTIHKKVLFIGVSLLLFLIIINPSVMANGKQGLAQLVMEHQERIEKLEQFINGLSNSSSSEFEPLPPEVKEAFLKEAENYISMASVYTYDGEDGGGTIVIEIDDIQLIEADGRTVLQIYTEGNYDWTGDYRHFSAKSFARDCVAHLDTIAKMYGIDLKFEFYENGERIRVFR